MHASPSRPRQQPSQATLTTPESTLLQAPAPATAHGLPSLYEGLLMFGVVFIAGYLFGTLSQTRHALDNRHALQGFLFVVFGIYFTWFWAKGQTLAMKTWAHPRSRCARPTTEPRARTVALHPELAVVFAALAGRCALCAFRPGNHRHRIGLGSGLGHSEPLSPTTPIYARCHRRHPAGAF